MPLPRSSLVSLDVTPFYHCISRCVRRTHLCGIDDVTGKSYEKRRDWLESRLLFLTDVFAIRLCSYSIMHNHYHTVLHLEPSQSVSWTDQDIITRWHKIYRGSTLSRSFVKDEPLGPHESEELHRQCVKWRERLCSISWFMKSANEPLARMANKEDDCTGHFWEGRFKSKAILDYKALMTSMVYTDLNPIKAGISQTIYSSNHTSIKTSHTVCKQSTKSTWLNAIRRRCKARNYGKTTVHTFSLH